MIGVNVAGHDPKTLKKVVSKEKLNWRSFADKGNAIARQWNHPGTPMFYVIDHKGTIRRKWSGSPGAKAMDTVLRKLIEKVKTHGRRQRK